MSTEIMQSSERIYQGKIIRVRRDAILVNGVKPAFREIVEHNGGVAVAALTEQNELLFARQLRYAYGEELLEIPAGKRDSKDEDPLACGMRELREETGATAEQFIPLGKVYPTPGYCTEIIWLFGCRINGFGARDLDEDEDIAVERIPLEKAVEMVMNNEINDSKTICALMMARKILKG
jgi:ADP-ribose pyrophosphatase